MFYVFLLIVAALGAGAYMALFLTHVPGASDERLGRLEPLPDDLGKWKVDEESEAGRAAARAGLKREERCLYREAQGLFGAGKFVRQTRYRSLETGEIVRAEPEVVTRRKRVKGSAA